MKQTTRDKIIWVIPFIIMAVFICVALVENEKIDTTKPQTHVLLSKEDLQILAENYYAHGYMDAINGKNYQRGLQNASKDCDQMFK
jgi:hypothetical protein